uniref:Uncharacterized protein n=1 Tax=Spumella elongata TaxID=89044 RepID=A0A7S3MEM7_9STRA
MIHFAMTISACDVFLTLASSLQVDILVNWLSLMDVGRLDSAICATRHRDLLLSVFKEEFCVFQEASKVNSDQILWINRRRIKLADVWLPRDFDSIDALALFFQVTGKYLQRLNASSIFLSQEMTEDNIREKLTMLAICINLQQLQLRSVDFKSVDLGPLLSTYPQLENLDLSFCKNVGGEILFDITNRVNNLRTLDIHQCKICGEVNLALVSDNHQIQKLYLSIAKESPNMAALPLHCKALRALYVKSILLNDVSTVLSHCPALRVLSASVDTTSSPRLTTETADILISLIQKLLCLHLDYGYKNILEDEHVLRLIAQCPNLKALIVTSTYVSSTIESIFDAAMQIPSVNLSVHQLNTLYVESIPATTLQRILSFCPHLTTFAFTGTLIIANSHDLMLTIGQSTITSLFLYSYNHIYSTDILLLRNLSRLTLRCCSLTDLIVVGLVNQNPHLRVLSLTDSPNLTKNCILYIIKNCKYLEEFEFDSENPYIHFSRREGVEKNTRLQTELIQFFRPNLKKLYIHLVEQSGNSYYYN